MSGTRSLSKTNPGSTVPIRGSTGLTCVGCLGSVFSFIGSRGKLAEREYGSFSESGQGVGQVATDRYLEPSAAFNDGENGSDFGSCLFASEVEPVFASECDGPHGVLGKVVAQLKHGIGKKERELIPP